MISSSAALAQIEIACSEVGSMMLSVENYKTIVGPAYSTCVVAVLFLVKYRGADFQIVR